LKDLSKAQVPFSEVAGGTGRQAVWDLTGLLTLSLLVTSFFLVPII